MRRDFKFIAELPSGYEYKLIQIGTQLKLIGVHPDKEPIGFAVEADYTLRKINISPEGET